MFPGITPRNRAKRRQLNHLASTAACALATAEPAAPEVPAVPKSPPPELRPRYVTIDAACRYAGIGRSKFYREYLGRVRTLRLGRRNLVQLASLDELLDELERAS
jgi:hypothetical protein